MLTMHSMIFLIILVHLVELVFEVAANNVAPEMWDIVQGNPMVLLEPYSAGCVPGESFCLPIAQQSLINGQACDIRLCTPGSSNISSAFDGNLATSFVTKSTDRLDLSIQFAGSYQIFYVRIAFSVNPPTAIAISRKLISDGPWLDWQYFGTDCLSLFGTPASPQASSPTGVICSQMPWPSQNSNSVSTLVWNVLGGRPGVASLDSNPLLQDFSTAVAIRLSFRGHTWTTGPTNLGTNYGANVYGIAELGIYGRCGQYFYRSASSPPVCLPCNCSAIGSLSPSCSSTGLCSCRPNFFGPTCNICAPGYYNISAGCSKCQCDLLGSQADVCSVSGECLCRPGFAAPNCSQCRPGHYLLGHICVPCECNQAGSLSAVCDRNGTCLCKRLVTGKTCSVCVDGSVDLAENNPNGCSPLTTETTATTLPASTTTLGLDSSVLNPNFDSSPTETSTPVSTTSTSVSRSTILQQSELMAVTGTTAPVSRILSREPFTVAADASSAAESTTPALPSLPIFVTDAASVDTTTLRTVAFSTPTMSTPHNLTDNTVATLAASALTAQVYSDLYPWLVAIIVLLVIGLLILIAHLIYSWRRSVLQRTYSPRQVPEFLNSDGSTRRHPDYQRRPFPPTGNAKLTGYFYNPEYPLDSLTPGVQRRNEEDTQEYTADEQIPARTVAQRPRPPPLDLTKNPPTTGLLSQRPKAAAANGLSTVSGGIVNENFHVDDET